METKDIKAGDTVKLVSTATYYDGRIIPAWVKSDTWIVESINGDRVVINKNTARNHEIKSPVNVKNLYRI